MTYETFLEKINALSDEEFREHSEESVSFLKEHIEEASPLECKELILNLEKFIWAWDDYEREKSIEEFLNSIPKEFWKNLLFNRLFPKSKSEKEIDLSSVKKFLNSEHGKEMFSNLS